MKLSMWMIANRLSSLDMELDIREDAPVALKSARHVYATNCVHIYKEKGDLVCNGEGNIIRIQNMDIKEGVEIIQSVFDYFQDWMDELIRLIREKNYQGVVDLAWQVFQNPIVMNDGNNRVLGITRQYPEDALDEEWSYLARYGYTSLNAIQQMKYQYKEIEFWRHGAQSFDFCSNRLLRYRGLSYCMYYNEADCGRITVLEKERPLNPGDGQLLALMASLLEPSLGHIYYEQVMNTGSNTNVFYSLISGIPYSRAQLESQLSYQQWDAEGTFSMALIRILDLPGRPAEKENTDLLMQVVLSQLHGCIVMKKGAEILILSEGDLSHRESALQFLDTLTARNPVKIGFSLPGRGIENIHYLCDQAIFAVNCAAVHAPRDKFCRFFDYATDFIIESASLESSVHACVPGLSLLWEMQQISKDELFHTLEVFLDNERSVSRTSALLFTHRNTVLYRIRKVQEFLHLDLEDAYLREYCRLSIRVLTLFGKKKTLL